LCCGCCKIIYRRFSDIEQLQSTRRTRRVADIGSPLSTQHSALSPLHSLPPFHQAASSGSSVNEFGNPGEGGEGTVQQGHETSTHSGAIRIGMPTRISSVRVATEDSAILRCCTKEAITGRRAQLGGANSALARVLAGKKRRARKLPGQGQGRGDGLRHRAFRPMTGCGCCWGARGGPGAPRAGAPACWFWSLEIGDSKVWQAKTKNRSLDLSSIQYSRRARLVEWEPDVQWEDSDGWGVCHMGLMSMINLH
jgi:hypothetical protein